MSVLPDAPEKAAYVQRMFARIAPRYDMANSAMTCGLDRRWRQHVVETVAPPVGGAVLDVGTGTGDFLPLLAAWVPGGVAVGVDFCPPMMQQGWAKLEHPPPHAAHLPAVVAFAGGDALHLPFADGTFDAITTGFMLRNVTDIAAAFREMWRVSKHGATLACLEVARPRNPLLRFGHRLYFHTIVPLIGGIISGSYRSYVYLPQSAQVFPTPDELAQIIRAAGWQSVHYRLPGLGAVAIHRAIKL